jgi:hypothetical protein
MSAIPTSSRLNTRQQTLLVAGGLLTLAALLLRQALFQGGAYYERDLLIYMEMADAFVRSIVEGAWPLRDPALSFGQPILGTPDTGVLYPPNWLHLAMLPHRAYTFILLFHYALGALGAAALAWRMTSSRFSAFFAGAFWVTSGPALSFLTLWHHLAGAAWMPWVLVAFDRLLERADGRRTLVVASVFGIQILAGSADMCAMTLSLALLRLILEPKAADRPSLGRVLTASLIALAIAACLGAATWLTVAEISRHSARAGLPDATRNYWSVHPALLPELILPLNLASLGMSRDVTDAVYEGREPFVKSLFLGPLVIPLFLGAAFSRNIDVRYRKLCGIGAGVALVFSLGRFTPVADAVATVLPILKIFRFPSKVLVPVALLTATLAGAGITALKDTVSRRIAGLVAVAAAVLHVLLWMSAPWWLSQITGVEASELGSRIGMIRSALAVSVAPLAVLAFAVFRRSARLPIVAGFLAIAASVAVNGDLNPVVSERILGFRPEHLSFVRTAEPSRVFAFDYLHSRPISRKYLGRESPVLGMKLDGVPPVVGYVVAVRSMLASPGAGSWGLEYGWDADFRGLQHNALRDMTYHLRDIEDPALLTRMLQLSNVAYAVGLHRSSFAGLSLEHSVPIPPLQEPLLVFKVPSPLPRAYAVSGVRPAASSAAAVGTVIDPRFDPWSEAVIEGAAPRPVSSAFESAVTIVSRRSDRIEVQATLNEPGEVILLEGTLPGWTATLDGSNVPVRVANGFFLAASAPAGSHRLVFTYRPLTAVLGVAITGVTALLLLIALGRRLGSSRA